MQELFGWSKLSKKVWIKLDRNVSIQFNAVFENYASIQKSIEESTALVEQNWTELVSKKKKKFIYSYKVYTWF